MMSNKQNVDPWQDNQEAHDAINMCLEAIAGRLVEIETWEECCQRCRANSECFYFTFEQDKRDCYLKADYARIWIMYKILCKLNM